MELGFAFDTKRRSRKKWGNPRAPGRRARREGTCILASAKEGPITDTRELGFVFDTRRRRENQEEMGQPQSLGQEGTSEGTCILVSEEEGPIIDKRELGFAFDTRRRRHQPASRSDQSMARSWPKDTQGPETRSSHCRIIGTDSESCSR